MGANSKKNAVASTDIPATEPKKAELRAFLFLTVVMAPVLAAVVVMTYGLFVWIYQFFAGPPGPG
jgi:nitrate reductase NapE